MWCGQSGTLRFVFITSSFESPNEIPSRSLSKWWSNYEMLLSLIKKRKKKTKYAGGYWASRCHSLSPSWQSHQQQLLTVQHQIPIERSYQSSPGRIKQLLCLLNPPHPPKKNQDSPRNILTRLTNISFHKIFSFSRIRSRDGQINISDGNQALRLNICNPAFFLLPFFCFSGPRICSNLQHGSVSWQQDAQEMVPKKLWADLHIIPDHNVDTHGAFLFPFCASSLFLRLMPRESFFFHPAFHFSEQFVCIQMRI